MSSTDMNCEIATCGVAVSRQERKKMPMETCGAPERMTPEEREVYWRHWRNSPFGNDVAHPLDLPPFLRKPRRVPDTPVEGG